MQLNPAVFDVWVFRRTSTDVEYLLLQASELKAARHFNGGRFWQIPSSVFRSDESVPAAVDRALAPYQLRTRSIWAAEHAYTIYNRRFHELQIISVFAVEVADNEPHLDPVEHSDYRWLPFDAALATVHYRGLKDGLRSVREYITEPDTPAHELCLRSGPATP
ncbi:MAG TPA: NUDIX domain-containing protein [Gemmatimonadaceae bacterium]|nr:NUDIX domain-containing protein [Gemmatimonadaceae bacterium]